MCGVAQSFVESPERWSFISCDDAQVVEIFFWFIRKVSEVNFEGKSWADLLKEWLKRIPAAGRFTSVDGQVVTLRDMTAEDYVESDPLDLDHLSTTTTS